MTDAISNVEHTKPKSYCVISMPRTGSEVLCTYLEHAFQFARAAEFLSIHDTIATCESVENKNFFDNITFTKVEFETAEQRNQEFFKRLEIIKKYEAEQGPVVVKCHLYVLWQVPNLYEILQSHFNIIVLVRRDSFSSLLSNFICRKIGVWHSFEDHEVVKVKQQLKKLRFSIDDKQWHREIMLYNQLIKLHQLAKNNKNSLALYYEDYASDPDPVVSLNKIFNKDCGYKIELKKFIDDHEKHVRNIKSLKDIYNNTILNYE